MFVFFPFCEYRLVYFKTSHWVQLVRGIILIYLAFSSYQLQNVAGQVAKLKKTYLLANCNGRSNKDEAMPFRKLKGDIKITEM